VCRRFREAGGSSGAGDEVVVVVVDVVGVVDGTDGAVARDDVAGDGGDDGLVGVSLACMPVSQVLGGSVDVSAFFRSRGGSSLGSVCVTALAVEVSCVVWVSTLAVGTASVWVSKLTWGVVTMFSSEVGLSSSGSSIWRAAQ
jgi:hypothetical protein